MHLFDPLRPKSPLGQPTWLKGNIVIGKLELFPIESGNIQVSVWLPIKGETAFACKRYTTIIEPIFLAGLIKNFTLDPEETVEYLFSSQQDEPELRQNGSSTTTHTPANVKSNKSLTINTDRLVASF